MTVIASARPPDPSSASGPPDAETDDRPSLTARLYDLVANHEPGPYSGPEGMSRLAQDIRPRFGTDDMGEPVTPQTHVAVARQPEPFGGPTPADEFNAKIPRQFVASGMHHPWGQSANGISRRDLAIQAAKGSFDTSLDEPATDA